MKNFSLKGRWANTLWILLWALSVPTSSIMLISQESFVEMVRKTQPAVVTVLSLDENGDLLRRGTGFFADQEGNLVTTRHVLFGARRVEIRTHDGRIFNVQSVISEDESQDLIRLTVAGLPAAPAFLRLSDISSEVGERVLVIGNPMGYEGTVTDGLVSEVRDMPSYGKVLQISAPISPGSSGGPVLNSQGIVIGIAGIQASPGQNLNFAVLARHVVTMKVGKEVHLAEWSKRTVKQWADSADGLYNAGLEEFSKRDYQKALSLLEQAVTSWRIFFWH